MAEEERVSKGDFVLVDYTGRVKETGEVFETTVEEVAREAGIYSEGRRYGPRLIIVGEGWVLRGLDEGLEGLKVGEKAVIEVPPEKGFGPRNPDDVKTIPYRVLRSKGVVPRIGMRVEVDGRRAVVRAVGAGRVTVDFNPPLAGRTLVYEVVVRKRIEGKVEKVRALIHRRIPVDPEKFKVTVKGGSVVVRVPTEAMYLEGIQLAKRGVASDILKYIPDVKRVRFVEEFERGEEKT